MNNFMNLFLAHAVKHIHPKLKLTISISLRAFKHKTFLLLSKLSIYLLKTRSLILSHELHRMSDKPSLICPSKTSLYAAEQITQVQ